MRYKKYELVLGLNEAMRSHQEDACREFLQLLRPMYNTPAKDIAKLFAVMDPEDVKWLKDTILNKS